MLIDVDNGSSELFPTLDLATPFEVQLRRFGLLPDKVDGKKVVAKVLNFPTKLLHFLQAEFVRLFSLYPRVLDPDSFEGLGLSAVENIGVSSGVVERTVCGLVHLVAF